MKIDYNYFFNDLLNVGLSPYQTLLFNRLLNSKKQWYFCPVRGCGENYYKMLLRLKTMNDYDVITIITPKGRIQKTKDEFIELICKYIQKEVER